MAIAFEEFQEKTADMKNPWVRGIYIFIVFTCIAFTVNMVISGGTVGSVLLTSAISGVLFAVLFSIYLSVVAKRRAQAQQKD
ncbi:cation transporter-like permease [Aurantimicrobium minutum]|nr:cation transporter-like permease [Aurantimicrobium minutum]